MKNLKYLVVNGCSFSRHPHEPNHVRNTFPSDKDYYDYVFSKRYSTLLADKLNVKEVNLSTGGSSNDRIFRTTYDWIQENKEKVKDTLFVIGLTDSLRKDLWSNFKQDYMITSEIWQDLEYIAKDCDTTIDKVNQWREFEVMNLVNEDEVEKNIIRQCDLFNSYVNGNVVFINAFRRNELVHTDLNFLKFTSDTKTGYNWVDYIYSNRSKYLQNDPKWEWIGHPETLQHNEISEMLYHKITGVKKLL